MSDIEHSNEHLANWAMQVIGNQRSTFSERVEARTVLAKIVEQADAYQGAVEVLREIAEYNVRATENGVLDGYAIQDKARALLGGLLKGENDDA